MRACCLSVGSWIAMTVAMAVVAAPSVLVAGDATKDVAPDVTTADAAELESYRLSTPALQKVIQAQRNVYAALQADPTIEERLAAQSPPDAVPSLSRAVATMESVPELKKAVTDGGISVREYTKFLYVLTGTTMAAGMMPEGTPLPPDSPPGLVDNLKWVQANEAELAAFYAEMDRLSGQESKDEAADEAMPEGEYTDEAAADSAGVQE